MTLACRRALIAMAILIAAIKFFSFAAWLVAPSVDPRFVGRWSGADFRGGVLTLCANGTGEVQYPSRSGERRVGVQWWGEKDRLTLRFVGSKRADAVSDVRTHSQAFYARVMGQPSPLAYHSFAVLEAHPDSLRLKSLETRPRLVEAVHWERVGQ